MFTIFKKLITHEDPYWFHKIPGILCLSNFIYQFYNYINNGSVILNSYFIAPHILIHFTSFIFKVLEKRPFNNKTNMFIWEELRLHSMVFAYRGCFILLYPDYSKEIVFATLYISDTISYFVGDKNVSTVRGNHDRMSKSLLKKCYGAFFSISQMGATLICSGCFQENISDSLVFFTLPAIQTSAFGLTLLRKNIISKSTWSIIYSFELIIVYIFWYNEYRNLNVLYISTILYLLRTFNVSKYLIWSSVFIIDSIIRNNHFDYFVKIHQHIW